MLEYLCADESLTDKILKIATATGDKENDTLPELLKFLDIPGLRDSISSAVRALGFGPEADGIATALVVILALLWIIGATTGPKATDKTDGKTPDDQKK